MSAEEQPFSPLVGAIITKMFDDRTAIENALIDGYKAQILDLEAELYAIREGVNALLGHPWTPSSDAISGAVFLPSPALRDVYLKRYAEEGR